VGVHSNPINATLKSYNDKDCFGVYVTTVKANFNGLYKGGTNTKVGTLHVAVGDIMVVEVADDQLKVRLESGAWEQTISLPAGRIWYPHYNTHSASFCVLDESEL